MQISGVDETERGHKLRSSSDIWLILLRKYGADEHHVGEVIQRFHLLSRPDILLCHAIAILQLRRKAHRDLWDSLLAL
jgi:hypothetical protein